MPEGTQLPPPAPPAWRRIDPFEIGLRRALFRPLAPVAFRIGTLPATLAPLGEAEDAALPSSLELLIAGQRGWLELPQTLVERLARLVDPDLPVAALHGDMLALVLELALLEPIEALERRLGQPVRLVTLQPAPPPKAAGLRLACRLTIGDTRFALTLALPRQTARLVAGLFERGACDAARFGLRVELACELGRSWATAGDLKRLGRGDVILPTELLRPSDWVVLTVADRWRATGTLAGRELTLTSRLRPCSLREEEISMDDAAGADALDRTFDDLPIRLVFEAGRIEIPFAELGELGPGQVLLLPGEPAAPIDILANGRRIGAGELVRIGERIGIRVTSLTVQGPGTRG
ncbi:MAG TPA: type III secretion system cytoplasmic ring protein SctQ [Actinocrinis sp.]|nr:type III secretion system cytoplasmic ring protein SctQ [Actinocrinis sp.]